MALPDEPRARARWVDELVSWFEANQRALPWRRPPHRGDPYAVLVSEVMAQQTRVETVAPYFVVWMRRWPRVEDLAAADEHEVLHAWQGLGYYARARRLHAAARQVADTLEGTWPTTATALSELPGVGPYTAAAIASFVFDEPVACVDGNIARVVARLEGDRVDIADPAVRRRTADRLGPLLAIGPPGAINEALMELGATVCTPQTPACERCPVADACDARAQHRVDEVPAPTPRKKLPTIDVQALLIEAGGRVLLRQRPEGGLLAGLWGLPMAENERAPFGLEPEGDVLAALRHTFTHKRWAVTVRRANSPERLRSDAWRWQPLDQLDALAMATLDRRLFDALEPSRFPSAW